MTILYIDDDAEDREIFHDIVHAIDPSLVCHIARNGQEALKELAELMLLPDFIFLDVNMPVMGGKEFLGEIKRIPRLCSIPVVMYSTTSHPNERQEFLRLGASQVLVKPSSIIKAHELISSTIKGSTIFRYQ